jgi:methionyl-tRNA formyltransferase
VAAIERLVFFGTPEFAVPSLDALVAAGRAPLAVVTQPPRPAGRGRRLSEPAVARRARELGLPVRFVERVRAAEFLAEMAALAPDLAVVVAFGQIFPRALLELPRLGCVNLHASLLPRWRGAAPIAAAIDAGDAVTGVTTQKMEEGLDTGPVYGALAVEIGPEETLGELTERLARRGAELIVESIAELERGAAAPRAQDDALATYAPKLAGPVALDLRESAARLARRVRAATPEPGATLTAGSETLRVLAARELAPEATVPDAPGTVVGVADGMLRLVAGGGSVLGLARVQRPGRGPVSGRDFANGARLTAGGRLD